METKKFTEILKNRIKEYGFTQKSFAEKMGMTLASLDGGAFFVFVNLFFPKIFFVFLARAHEGSRR